MPHLENEPQVESNSEVKLQAVRQVLQSRTFSRASGLSRILHYLCESELGGRGEEITEYSIGVMALGRREGFDPKIDTIVRVEMHHLRRRLKLYYENEGLSHSLRIAIPTGQYRPAFIEVDTGSASPEVAEPEKTKEKAPPPLSGERAFPTALTRRLALRLAVSAAFLGLVASAGFLLWFQKALPKSRAVQTVTPLPDDGSVRLLCGRKTAYTDTLGLHWLPDQFASGGAEARFLSARVTGGWDSALYEAGRKGEEFRYDVPLTEGAYEVRLHLAEPEVNLISGRILNLFANGRPVLTGVDVLSESGGLNLADIRVVKNLRPASDGLLHLLFQCKFNACIVNAIEIVPSGRDTMRPIRVVARAESYVDVNGRLWLPDHLFQGGATAARKHTINGAEDPGLFFSERYGSFSYAVPVPPGRYRVKLYFSEMWFGATNPAKQPVSCRVFNVSCNGRSLLDKFVIGNEAGGENRPLIKEFRDLEPNPAGKLVFTFVPVKNYASLNAIEVLDET